MSSLIVFRLCPEKKHLVHKGIAKPQAKIDQVTF